MNYQDENNKLAESFFNRTFVKSWQTEDKDKEGWMHNYSSLELDINYKCNLSCKYCYISRYGEELYPKELYEDDNKILNNLNILLDWLVEKKLFPDLEIFTGEAFVQPITFTAINMILDKLSPVINRTIPIVIPTNYTFLLSNNLTKKVEDIIEKSKNLNMPIVLSASIDGKYCEINRPFKAAIESGEPNAMRSFDWKINPNFVDPRGDEFYDKFFTFAAKYNFGFHPMVYSENIEYWRDNFLWFQENFRKHDISWKSLYLLEVRNAEWSLEQCKEFAKFTEFLVMWSWNMCNQSYDNYKEFLFRNKGFNMLSSPLTTIGRGIGCSYQSSVQLRLGDLNIMPCHRTCYPHLMIAKFNVQNNKIVGLNAQSPELWIGSFSTDSNTYPYCEQCGIKNLCTKGCLGSQLESTGDMFTPIPSTCRMEHYKLKGMITAYKRIGIFNELINSLDSRKIESFKYLEGLI